MPLWGNRGFTVSLWIISCWSSRLWQDWTLLTSFSIILLSAHQDTLTLLSVHLCFTLGHPIARSPKCEFTETRMLHIFGRFPSQLRTSFKFFAHLWMILENSHCNQPKFFSLRFIHELKQQEALTTQPPARFSFMFVLSALWWLSLSVPYPHPIPSLCIMSYRTFSPPAATLTFCTLCKQKSTTEKCWEVSRGERPLSGLKGVCNPATLCLICPHFHMPITRVIGTADTTGFVRRPRCSSPPVLLQSCEKTGPFKLFTTEHLWGHNIYKIWIIGCKMVLPQPKVEKKNFWFGNNSRVILSRH